jgi:quinol monooxygenase YgiN
MLLRILEGKARPGKVQEIADLLIQQGEDVVKKTKGCLFIHVLNSGDELLAVSAWRAAEDMERYLEHPETKTFYGKLPALLMGVPAVRTFEVLRSMTGDDAGSDAAAWRP